MVSGLSTLTAKWLIQRTRLGVAGRQAKPSTDSFQVLHRQYRRSDAGQFWMPPTDAAGTTTVAWRIQNERSGASNQADLQTLNALKSGIT